MFDINGIHAVVFFSAIIVITNNVVQFLDVSIKNTVVTFAIIGIAIFIGLKDANTFKKIRW